MDKQEYKLRVDEIDALIAKRDFFGAVKIADTIDWTRVRSVAKLCKIGDLYKVNRRYKESKELFEMAYQRHPSGRMILYSLCELCIKMGEVVQALEYYKEFVQLAPMDNGRYVLQYKIYVAQDVSLEERIAVLEELKKRDYREKWGYELAYLYHRIGLTTKCVEECDELILWFSDGRYVKKAMELKMLHQPLTAAQEASYNSFVGKNAELPKPEPVMEKSDELDIKVKPMSVGQYDTINLQKALAESMKEVLSPVVPDVVKKESESVEEEEGMGSVTSQIMAPMFESDTEKEVYFEDTTGEMAPVPSQMEELMIAEEPETVPAEKARPGNMQEVIAGEAVPAMAKAPIADEDEQMIRAVLEEDSRQQKSGSEVPTAKSVVPDDKTKEIPSIREIMRQPLTAALAEPVDRMETVPSRPAYTADGIPTTMADVLSQEYDGQISLVVPENITVEKQITGQMNIDDVLTEWEKTKKEHEEKRKAELTQKVKEQTGTMFSDFEAKVRDGILEQLQKEHQLIPAAEEDLGEVEELEEIAEPAMEEEIVIPDIIAEEETPAADAAESESSAVFEETAEAAIEEEGSEESQMLSDQEETLQKIQQAQEDNRELTEEEVALFAPFIQTKGAKKRFLKALDLISLAAYTGNVIVTGDTDTDTVKLAKNIMKNIQMTDSNFSGVIAKVSGASLNSKSVESTVAKLNNGGLIIEKASEMNSQAVMKLLKALNQEKTGIVVILEDTGKAMKRMLAAYPSMSTFFNARVEIEKLNTSALAAYGKQYAAHMEYAIDELGMLALSTQITNRQTSTHNVTVAEVRELIDEAIESANRKNLGHFFDVVLGKRYDEEDMIILREKDFR